MPPPHPTDYFVPNFGLDSDIKNTAVDLEVAQKALGHKWDYDLAAKSAKGPPVDYFVPNFGMDHDVKDSIKHLENQEKIHGAWKLPEENVQLEAKTEREPLLTWRRSPTKSHPVNYFVPNFGTDHDISTSQSNENAAETKLGHKWEPVVDPETEKYIVPSPQIEFKLLQTDSEISREPLTGWAPTISKPDHPMNYFIPNFGLDHDMVETKKSYELEQDLKKHDWVIPDPKSLPAPHPTDYFVPNFGLDHDIVSSISDLNEAEKTNGKWNLSQYKSFGQAPENAMPFKMPESESTLQLSEHTAVRKMVKDQSKIDAKLNKIAIEHANRK